MILNMQTQICHTLHTHTLAECGYVSEAVGDALSQPIILMVVAFISCLLAGERDEVRQIVETQSDLIA